VKDCTGRLLSFRNLVAFLHLGVDFLYGQVRISMFTYEHIYTLIFVLILCSNCSCVSFCIVLFFYLGFDYLFFIDFVVMAH
jgi:hypothetical protein